MINNPNWGPAAGKWDTPYTLGEDLRQTLQPGQRAAERLQREYEARMQQQFAGPMRFAGASYLPGGDQPMTLGSRVSPSIPYQDRIRSMAQQPTIWDRNGHSRTQSGY